MNERVDQHISKDLAESVGIDHARNRRVATDAELNLFPVELRAEPLGSCDIPLGVFLLYP